MCDPGIFWVFSATSFQESQSHVQAKQLQTLLVRRSQYNFCYVDTPPAIVLHRICVCRTLQQCQFANAKLPSHLFVHVCYVHVSCILHDCVHM